ncbi:hypothetical protein KY320_00635 [Candidatus Woesearchaeota archaeon]|nr:hypothetical protein [Candidatus Woesearchaeota archaeon]
MAEDDYDLMPHAEMLRLKGEVKELRQALAAKKGGKVTKQPPGKEGLQVSMDNLATAINSLMALFKQAGDDIQAEHHHTTHEHLGDMNAHLEALNAKMEKLLKHNEEIAKGILVVAELVKEEREEAKKEKRSQNFQQHSSAYPKPSPPIPPIQF